jgi:hypothetical protein
MLAASSAIASPGVQTGAKAVLAVIYGGNATNRRATASDMTDSRVGSSDRWLY